MHKILAYPYAWSVCGGADPMVRGGIVTNQVLAFEYSFSFIVTVSTWNIYFAVYGAGSARGV